MTQVAIFHCEVIICNLNVEVYIQLLERYISVFMIYIFFFILILDGHDEHGISIIPKYFVSMFSVDHNGHRCFKKNSRCVYFFQLHNMDMEFLKTN